MLAMLKNSIILSQNKSILYPFIKFLETPEELLFNNEDFRDIPMHARCTGNTPNFQQELKTCRKVLLNFIYFLLLSNFELNMTLFSHWFVFNLGSSYMYHSFLIRIHSKQGLTATIRHGVTRKRRTKRGKTYTKAD